MLHAQQIEIKRKQKTVLDINEITVNPGELVVLLGPNGAGKTTLLNALCGDLKSAKKEGRVELNSRALDAYPLNERAQHLVVLPQRSDIPFPLSVLEVVLLGRTPHSSTHHENLAIAKQCLAQVDMAGAENKHYPELSGGEQQRVQLERVLAQLIPFEENSKTRYLLLDEPTSALDLAHQHLLLRHLRELTKQNIGIIMTVHDLNLAMQYATRVVLLQDGKEVANGSPGDVLSAENIEAVFNLPVTLLSHNAASFIMPLS